MDDLTHPDPQALLCRLADTAGFFARLSYVRGVVVFGSIARDVWDRWSDGDLVVLTETRESILRRGGAHARLRRITERLPIRAENG